MSQSALLSSGLMPGFPDPVLDSQSVFRILLNAMASPGETFHLPIQMSVPTPLHSAAAAACLALLDFETPLWMDERGENESVSSYLRFHCGCPLVNDPGEARFALISRPTQMPSFDRFEMGSEEYPDRSATLILQVSELKKGEGRRLTGPGIETERYLNVNGLPDKFWPAFQENHAWFPRGVDVIFTSGEMIAALPRTVQVEE